MSGIRNRIEKGFEKLSDIIFDHRYQTLLVMILFVGMIASQIPKITIDTSTEGFFHKDDQSPVDYRKFRVDDEFVSNDVPVVKAWSIATVLKEIHQALHADNKEYYSIPREKKLVVREFLLSDYFIAPSLMIIVNRNRENI